MVYDNTFFRWGLITLLIVVIAQVLGDVFNLFYIFPKLDIPMHILGGMLVGFFALAYTPRGMNNLQKLLWVIVWTIVIGLLVEVIEYLVDHYANLTMALQHGTEDTLTDILHDFIGGIIAFSFGYFGKRL